MQQREGALGDPPECLHSFAPGLPEARHADRILVAFLAIWCGVNTVKKVRSVRNTCAAHWLAAYKVPTSSEVRAEPLPWNAAGKLIERALVP